MRFLCLALWILATALHSVSGEIIVYDLAARGTGTLRDALDYAPDGSVVSFNTGGTIEMDGQDFYVPGKDLTVGTQNSPRVTIDGGNSTGLFSLNGASRPFTFANTVLTNGKNPGRGGAVYSEKKDIMLAPGMVVAANNSNSDGGGFYVTGGDVIIADGTVLTDNTAQVSGGGLYLESGNLGLGADVKVTGNSATTRDGGGIWAADTVTIGENTSIASNTAKDYGGGAFVRDGLLKLDSRVQVTGNSATARDGGGIWLDKGGLQAADEVQFFHNTAGTSGGAIWSRSGTLAFGDGASLSYNSAKATMGCSLLFGGGAVFSESGPIVFGADATITGNTSLSSGGGIAATYGSVEFGTRAKVSENTAVGHGGGIAMDTGEFTAGAGSVFSGNAAGCAGGGVFNRQGSVTFDDLARFVGNQARIAGGGLFAGGGGMVTNGVFDGNAASGDNVTEQVMGGAIYARGDFTLNGGAFFNNTAVAASPGGSFGGKGGAVFYDADGASSDLTLNVAAGESMRFTGNSHGDAPGATTPNSIYFGNTSETAHGTANLAVNVAAGGELVTCDPLGSQPDNTPIGNGGTFRNLTVNVDKKGEGIWRLSGVSRMDSQTRWRVSEGTLHLYRDEAAVDPARILMTAPSSSFELGSGAALALTPFRTPFEIAAPGIVLQTNSSVFLADYSYGPKLPEGKATILELNASGSLVNNASLPVTSGTLNVGFYTYDYQNLRWEENDSRLVADIGDAAVNRDFVCVCSVSGPTAAVLANAGSKLVFDRTGQQFFDQFAGKRHDEEGRLILHNGIWVASSATHNDFHGVGGRSGYDLNDSSTVLGTDRWFGDSVFIGLAGAYSRPDFKGGKTRFDADSYGGFLYGGALLPAGIELSAIAGYQATRFDQDRRALSEINRATYYAHVLTAGTGIARRFRIASSPLSIRPMATYEFIRQRTDGYREKGGASALTLAKTGQSIHRIHAGAEVSWEAPQGVRVAAQGWYRGIYGDVRSETPTYFTADPERHMFVNTSHKADRNSVGLGARLAIPLGTRAELGAEYALMLGTNSVSHQGSAVIGIGW